jgi:multidrug resistance efflux pump
MNNTTGEQELEQLKRRIEQEQRELDSAKQEYKKQQAESDRKKVDFDRKQSEADRSKKIYEESKVEAEKVLAEVQRLEQQRRQYQTEFDAMQRNLAELIKKH